MMTTFQKNISYGQIAVFLSDLKQPFNEWRDEHVAQGFSWRPGSVSFRTLEQGGIADVSVRRADVHQIRCDSVRAIAVPFSVPDDGRLEIASISDSQPLELPPGDYRLIFEHGLDGEGGMWCDFTFVPVEKPVMPEILRRDSELAPPPSLLMEAEPG